MSEEQANVKSGGGEADAPVVEQGSEEEMSAIVTGGTGATGKWVRSRVDDVCVVHERGFCDMRGCLQGAIVTYRTVGCYPF